MRISVRAIVIKDNKLLVMDRNRFGNKFMVLVGGAVEMDESQKYALKREVKGRNDPRNSQSKTSNH